MGTGSKFRDDRPLANNETRLRPYDKLSRGTKQEMDLSRRAALEQAKKEAGESDIGNIARDFINNESSNTIKGNAASRAARKADA